MKSPGWENEICTGFSAQVGEWLKPTDCKSVPPSEVRRFESFPVHHKLSRLAGVSEAGARWRNPERSSRGNSSDRCEPLASCDGCVCCPGSIGMGDDPGSADSLGHVGDSG